MIPWQQALYVIIKNMEKRIAKTADKGIFYDDGNVYVIKAEKYPKGR